MLSENLKRIMNEKGWKGNPLARKAGISMSYLSDLLNGKKENPSNEVLQKLADALEVTIDELLISDPTKFDNSLEELEETERILLSKIKKLDRKSLEKLSKMLEIFDGEVD